MDLYEVMGTHFVDVFYNHLYREAEKTASSGQDRSITAAYQRHVDTYVRAVQENKGAFKQIAGGLQSYVLGHIPMGFNNYTTFVDRVVVTLVPDRYFSSLQPAQKDEIFAGMVTDLVAGLAVYVTRPEILKVTIDHRDPPRAREFLATAEPGQDDPVRRVRTPPQQVPGGILQGQRHELG
jgi:hypothetical protein